MCTTREALAIFVIIATVIQLLIITIGYLSTRSEQMSDFYKHRIPAPPPKKKKENE